MKAVFLYDETALANMIFNVYTDDIIRELRSRVDIEKRFFSKEEVIRSPHLFSDVDFVFASWGMPKFTEEEIKTYLPSLKCIFYGAGTVQSFARPFLNSGVRIFSAWAANAVPVAEITAAMIILANKGYFVCNRVFNKSDWRASRNVFETCLGNYGETVGIIGAGTIGRLVISLLKSYRLNVLVFDPFLSDEAADELGVTKCDLETLFERSFVVSNHLADKAETKGILNYGLFQRMRENAVFINTGRGAQVVEDDLARILTEREDLSALLDVTFPEPPVKGHPFYSLSNCYLTPHIAGSSVGEVARLGEYMLYEFDLYLKGEPTKYEITKKMLDTMA